MYAEEAARRDIVLVSHAIHARGWVANHDGNASVRLGAGRYLATPTAVSKASVTPECLIVVDEAGAVVAGTRKGFSELKLHLAAYRARADVHAVLHAHPPHATALAVSGLDLGEPFMAEPVVSLGRRIPTVPFGMPGETALDQGLAEALGGAQAVLLANHGVLTVGPDLDTCLLRMELVEHICRIYCAARLLGGPVPLPAEVADRLQAQHEALFARVEAGGPAPVSAPPPMTGDARSVVESALRRFS